MVLLVNFLTALGADKPISIADTAKTDTVLNTPVKFSIAGDGFILSSFTQGSISPFYHASALFNSIITAKIGDNVSLKLRAVAEVWNFSDFYGSPQNLFTWAKPSINISVPINSSIVDEFYVQAGDMGRMKHGQGLCLDYFEAQGVDLKLKSKKLMLEFKTAGWGWTGLDDIHTLSLSYDTNFAVRWFSDYYNYSVDIISGDFNFPLWKGFNLYGEYGKNSTTMGDGYLFGAKYQIQGKKSYLKLSAEYRHYDASFLKFGNYDKFPYFNSLTAIDKPVNNFQYYQSMYSSDVDILSVRIIGKYFFMDKFFLFGDVESSVIIPAYQLLLGYEAVKDVDINIGFMNKFFRLYNSQNSNRDSMFMLLKELWSVISISYKF